VHVRTVAIVMAMRAEARPLVNAFDAVPHPVPARRPFEWFVADRDDHRVVIAVNGVDPRHRVDLVGTEPAVLNTGSVIDTFAPDLVISAGTAGGWQRAGASVGDVYVSWPTVVRHDRRIDIEELREYGIGGHEVWDGAPALADHLGARLGIVTTGNALDESATDREWILALDGEVKEMEAAAVAWVCELHHTPFVAVKTITDLVDHPTPTGEQFLANLRAASERLAAVVPAVVAHWAAGGQG
jgi:5'-methylthioadenosine nucleosidase